MAQDKTPLVWIDMEMSGLVPERDRILEVAMVATSSELDTIAEMGARNVLISYEGGCFALSREDLAEQLVKWRAARAQEVLQQKLP